MMILYGISKHEPDIKNELAAAISAQILESQEAFKNLGNKILVKLKKEM